MKNTEEVSRQLSHTLVCLGYSPQMVEIRKDFLKIHDELLRLEHLETPLENIMFKTVGSRKEGMVKLYESDWDQLLLNRNILVVEDEINTQQVLDSVTLFRMVPCVLHPGHCKLSLIRNGTGEDVTATCLNNFENGVWLSRYKYMARTKSVYSTVSGPAHTWTDGTKYFSVDIVSSFPFVCPRTIQKWIQRPRHFDWPPFDLKERISHMTGNIVATAHKGCQDKEIEWRLCFNEIELQLVETWNDTQRMLFKILKMVKKDVFVKAGFDITSYIMKNIVLWLSESCPQSEFRPDKLFLWIIKSLKLLRQAVKVNFLPYYMIVERNLIAEKIPPSQRKRLVKEISALIHSGPYLLLKCEKLEFAMSMTVNELLIYRYKLERLEMLGMGLWICIRYNRATNTVNTDIENKINIEYVILMCSTWPPVVSERIRGENALRFLLS